MNTARRNARGEASLRRILDATVQLVGRYGYDHTTIARITESTQRPASSIYWYFRDKDELIAAALEHSYTRFAREDRRPWQHYDRTLPMETQLIGELGPELCAAESETPLRVGLTLALEGSAARSKVREPFQRRRAATVQAIEAWWDSAYAHLGIAEDIRPAAVWWMSTFTLALLDGHCISEVVTHEDAVADRSRLIAYALTSAFATLQRTGEPVGHPASDLPAAHGESSGADESGTAVLLRATRRLVAEHGYEGATIGRICAASDMQRSSVYWRYRDKDALIKAAVAEPFLDLFAPLRALPDAPRSWTEELAAAITATLRAAYEAPSAVKAGLLLGVQQCDPPTAGGTAVLAGIAEVEAELAAWLIRNVASGESAGLPAEQVAWIVLRSIEGRMLGSALGRPTPVDTMTELCTVMMDDAARNYDPAPVSDGRGRDSGRHLTRPR